MTSAPRVDPSLTDPGAFWDKRFGAHHYVYGTRPNAFLCAQSSRLKPGMSVLAVGDGEGRNGVWLAQNGLMVSSVDASPEGVKKALQLALERQVTLQATCADLARWDWPQATFDAVVSVFLHLPPALRATAHRQMLAALRPGGLVILEAFRPEQLAHSSGGPRDLSLLYTADQLRDDFAGADILLLDEAAPLLDEGPLHQGLAATVQLVARRRA
ncbi:SAM-dependent methyltransferase [Insolitispirillum peregrinum]|uniref:SAM-dependent methyltransferase n=1 Tax=Insolitispirillum peregrinum TaxID=80876 RepID=UPI00360C862E